ncbi:MAG: hypothetical protein EAZ21_03565 [Betaproteobacteria bacterium]|nr:MAG: hypothetical protein EAZ21_03565 [Betaproteobacteria bacterium]
MRHSAAWSTARASLPIRLIAQEPRAQFGTVARGLLPAIGATMRNEIVIENHADADGSIATRNAATAAAEGMKVLLGKANNRVLARHLGREIGYDPEKDFSLPSAVARIPFAIADRSSLPVNNRQAFVKYGCAPLGTLTFGSVGVGRSSHLPVEAVAQQFQSNLLRVPICGSSPAANEVVAERADVVATTLHRLLPFAKRNKFRTVTVKTQPRLKLAPQVATPPEQGLGGFHLDPWRGSYAPRSSGAAVGSRWRAASGEPSAADKATVARANANDSELVSRSVRTVFRLTDNDRTRHRESAWKINRVSTQ